ncbi:MAG: response regulator transcription factor, partial [Cyanobacteria bacterium J06621_15]
EKLYETLQKPDLILMDVRMPVMDGVAATQIISQRFPDIKVMVLTTFNDTEYVRQAIKFGAKGYLMKDTLSDELANAIRTVHKGYTQFAPGIIEKALDDSLKTFPTSNINEPNNQQLGKPPQLALLSAREKEVLRLIANGYSNREIAEQLYIAENTVKNHVSNILYRLELRDRTQAAIFARSFLDE